MTEDERQPYQQMHIEDKARYEGEKAQLKELGYFVNKDGVKSTHLNNKGKVLDFQEGTMKPAKVKSTWVQYLICWHKKATLDKEAAKESGQEDLPKRSATDDMKELAQEWNNMSD